MTFWSKDNGERTTECSGVLLKIDLWSGSDFEIRHERIRRFQLSDECVAFRRDWSEPNAEFGCRYWMRGLLRTSPSSC
ncbi:unnamed protein product [Toxocara canis]|uniref:PLAT domain-containing protein n=2 Tax=Toxocara canis TaxID=6265 RepID=A0A183UJ52_TOXCA|nr:unnamed protein product [Toxocara canis]